ncbi:hypothetical protein D3C73_508940 [compost metagenome]
MPCFDILRMAAQRLGAFRFVGVDHVIAGQGVNRNLRGRINNGGIHRDLMIDRGLVTHFIDGGHD